MGTNICVWINITDKTILFNIINKKAYKKGKNEYENHTDVFQLSDCKDSMDW